MMEKKDEDLIRECQEGNDEALKMLFSRYKKPILNFAFRILGNRADAEDITGEVFLTLYTKSNLYQPKAKFSTWLFTVARNACITKIRKRKRSVSMWFTKTDSNEYTEWELPDQNSLPHEKLIKQENQFEVRKAIFKLPEQQKEALVLREYHSLSYMEISQVLGCSLENVKILLFRAREQLKDDLSSFIMGDKDE